METELSLGSNHKEEVTISHHVVAIPDDDNQEWMASVEQKITKMPRLLNTTAGRSSCCIFRVPRSLVENNRKAYEPYVVSIGPYHHGKEQLDMIQEHKWRFLGRLLKRGIGIGDLFNAIAPMEGAIRECYSETIGYTGKELVEMMVLDGCFIVELFRIVGGYVQPDDLDDPIFNISWLFYFLQRDLLRLENQIPYFVMKELYQMTRVHDPTTTTSLSLTELALGFFNYSMQRPQEVLQKHHSLDAKAKHLVDLYRLTLVPSANETRRDDSQFLNLIQSARNLQHSGIRFVPKQADTILDIRFHNGVLKIPPLTVDDSTTSLLLNCVAFEQCYSHCPKHITSYLTFMSCLIKSPQDAGYLCDKKVIENYIGNDNEVVRFFSNLGKDIAFDINMSYLAELFEDVNGYYRNNWHVRWADFKHTYFSTPWSFMSALAAAILLILTMIQAFFAVYSYVHPVKQP